MIVRVLTAQIAAPNVTAANLQMRELLDVIHAQPGLAYVKLSRRLLEGDAEEMLLFEEWLTPSDLFAWTGGHLEKARLPERTPRLFENLVITHYESLDRMPAEFELEVIEGARPAAASDRASAGR